MKILKLSTLGVMTAVSAVMLMSGCATEPAPSIFDKTTSVDPQPSTPTPVETTPEASEEPAVEDVTYTAVQYGSLTLKLNQPEELAPEDQVYNFPEGFAIVAYWETADGDVAVVSGKGFYEQLGLDQDADNWDAGLDSETKVENETTDVYYDSNNKALQVYVDGDTLNIIFYGSNASELAVQAGKTLTVG